MSEFKASLVYREEFQDTQGYTEKPCLEKKKKTNQKQSQDSLSRLKVIKRIRSEPQMLQLSDRI